MNNEGNFNKATFGDEKLISEKPIGKKMCNSSVAITEPRKK